MLKHSAIQYLCFISDHSSRELFFWGNSGGGVGGNVGLRSGVKYPEGDVSNHS